MQFCPLAARLEFLERSVTLRAGVRKNFSRQIVSAKDAIVRSSTAE
jgi:hypothetical protein